MIEYIIVYMYIFNVSLPYIIFFFVISTARKKNVPLSLSVFVLFNLLKSNSYTVSPSTEGRFHTLDF